MYIVYSCFLSEFFIRACIRQSIQTGLTIEFGQASSNFAGICPYAIRMDWSAGSGMPWETDINWHGTPESFFRKKKQTFSRCHFQIQPAKFLWCNFSFEVSMIAQLRTNLPRRRSAVTPATLESQRATRLWCPFLPVACWLHSTTIVLPCSAMFYLRTTNQPTRNQPMNN